MRKLDGEPGDGALEIFRDLERDIGATQAFIADWEHDTTPEIRAVVSIVEFTEQQLKILPEMYQTMMPFDRERTRVSYKA